MNPILSMHTWSSLTNEQRARIRALFSIPRSSHTIVNDGRIETDGTTPKDFEALTIEKMKVYLNSDVEDFHMLFNMVLKRVQDEIEGKPIEAPVIVEVVPPSPVVEPIIKKTRKSKK